MGFNSGFEGLNKNFSNIFIINLLKTKDCIMSEHGDEADGSLVACILGSRIRLSTGLSNILIYLCFLSFLQVNYKWATTDSFRIFPDSVFIIVLLVDIKAYSICV